MQWLLISTYVQKQDSIGDVIRIDDVTVMSKPGWTEFRKYYVKGLSHDCLLRCNGRHWLGIPEDLNARLIIEEGI